MAGIYIHIPFCTSKCFYCDFYSGPARSESVKSRFAEAVADEYLRRRCELTEPVETIYLGGGTPSQLPSQYLDRIISVLPLAGVTEFTMEVNPEDVDDDFAGWIASSPVNRVSMGIQSFNHRELDAIGRRHTPGKAVEAVKRLREAGIQNISLDLMYGLPHQTLESFTDSIRHTLELHPEHISAYALMLEPGTRLSAMISSGKINDVSQEESDMMYRRLCDMLGTAGYSHYEISNFALPGYSSSHNSSYWNLTPYLGLGPSAHSYTMGTRKYNKPSVKSYLAGDNPIAENTSVNEAVDEYIMIRLRTAEGIDINDFSSRFGEYRMESLLERASKISDRLNIDSSVISIPENLWLISDPIIVDLMTETD